MSYWYSFEDLLALLHGHAPAKVDAVALHRRRVEHGHLSVGLKIHCLGDGSQFSNLVEGLGGAQKILDVNYYKHSHASLCLVLPPVGSARSAILLLESQFGSRRRFPSAASGRKPLCLCSRNSRRKTMPAPQGLAVPGARALSLSHFSSALRTAGLSEIDNGLVRSANGRNYRAAPSVSGECRNLRRFCRDCSGNGLFLGWHFKAR